MYSIKVLFFVVCFCLCIKSDLNSQDEKHALIIGNSEYQNTSKLKNPINDAKDLSKVLNDIGFKTTLIENADQKSLKKAIDNFGKSIPPNAVALFFYAGHGMQSGGFNYLIPVDADLSAEEDIEYNCVRADRIISKMRNTSTNIVILDACRNNPFERSWDRSGGSRGLAVMDGPVGTIIAYATGPGKTAADGSGRNGLYTSSLLKHLKQPGLTIEQVFKRVRNEVLNGSDQRQEPWETSSLRNEFYFVPGERKDDANSSSAYTQEMMDKAYSEGFAKAQNEISKEKKTEKKNYFEKYAGSWQMSIHVQGMLVEVHLDINKKGNVDLEFLDMDDTYISVFNEKFIDDRLTFKTSMEGSSGEFSLDFDSESVEGEFIEEGLKYKLTGYKGKSNKKKNKVLEVLSDIADAVYEEPEKETKTNTTRPKNNVSNNTTRNFNNTSSNSNPRTYGSNTTSHSTKYISSLTFNNGVLFYSDASNQVFAKNGTTGVMEHVGHIEKSIYANYSLAFYYKPYKIYYYIGFDKVIYASDAYGNISKNGYYKLF